jgi:hypothetical protein
MKARIVRNAVRFQKALAQEEVDRRSALAVIEGDELGREPILGLLRRALEEYEQVCHAGRLYLHWELRDCPWLVLIPNHAELVAPWEATMGGGVMRRVQWHEAQLCTVAVGAVFLHGHNKRSVSRGMSVLKRIESAIIEVRQSARRQCRCGHNAPWVSFPFVGIQQDEPPLELRNCPNCQTTLAIELR